jgi:DnaJ-domain-containing protein 1
VSIGRRFIDMARAELNSLLDFAGRRGDKGERDPSQSGSDEDEDRADLHGFTAKELEEELERRRRAREEVDELLSGRRRANSADGPFRNPTEAGARHRKVANPVNEEALRIQKAYAALEVPAGSNFDTVRRAYRTLMRKYHPDRHTATPEKQKAANEVAQRLTESYKLLEKHLRR